MLLGRDEKAAAVGGGGGGGGRRRQALLERAAAPAPRLELDDVRALQASPTPEARAVIARKLGGSYDSLATGGTRDLAQAVLSLLLQDVETEVRRSLAESVATSENLPVPIARRLARDEITVARPILEQSPVLDDEELADIVRTNAMQYALAVAGRERISEALSDALVDSGHQEVVVRLVGNIGAKLSSRTLGRIVEDYRGDDEVQERLVRRPALPYEMIEQMVGMVGDSLEWEMIHKGRMDENQARAIMTAVRERAAIGLTAREHGDRNLQRFLRERFLAGELTHEEVLAFLRDGDIASFETAIGMLAELDTATARKLAYNPDRRYLAALAIRAGFPTPHYITLRMALDLAEETVQGGRNKRSYSGDSIQFLQAQYERLRLEEDKVQQLIDGEI